eukprot:COSAG02_NODE_28471_length_589_cov_0.667347_1_plen_97_part_01
MVQLVASYTHSTGLVTFQATGPFWPPAFSRSCSCCAPTQGIQHCKATRGATSRRQRTRTDLEAIHGEGDVVSRPSTSEDAEFCEIFHMVRLCLHVAV